jgi:hypothetical protein
MQNWWQFKCRTDFERDPLLLLQSVRPLLSQEKWIASWKKNQVLLPHISMVICVCGLSFHAYTTINHIQTCMYLVFFPIKCTQSSMSMNQFTQSGSEMICNHEWLSPTISPTALSIFLKIDFPTIYHNKADQQIADQQNSCKDRSLRRVSQQVCTPQMEYSPREFLSVGFAVWVPTWNK